MNYPTLLKEIKTRIRQGQLKAAISANAEMILMYWDIGRIVAEKQKEEGWGASIIPRLSKDIRNDLPEIKGFSTRNIDRMLAFYNEYSELVISPPPVAKLEADTSLILPMAVAKLENESTDTISPVALAKLPTHVILEEIYKILLSLPWAHNATLLQEKNLYARLWYMKKILENGWGHIHLVMQIKNKAYERQGKAITNFSVHLDLPQAMLAEETLKNPYLFDFLTLEETFHERELEVGLVQHLEKFLLELGAGFAFVGRQYHLEVSDQDFYIDLLFYHLKLRCFVVIELKKGDFKPEHVGKMNFYCSVVDDILKHAQDAPTIGLILCQNNNKIVAEYALRNINKPIGISAYELTRALPDNLKSSLPTVEEIEERLGEME